MAKAPQDPPAVVCRPGEHVGCLHARKAASAASRAPRKP